MPWASGPSGLFRRAGACGTMPMLATPPERQAPAAEREALAGLVERVTYHNPENGFCVLRVKARGQRDLVTLVGAAAAITAGEFVQASGTWVNDRVHGLQFKAAFLRSAPPTTLEGIEKYLGSGMVKGIGPVYAGRLVRVFGEGVSTSSRASPTACARWTGSAPSAWTGSSGAGRSRRSSARSCCSCTRTGSAPRARCGSSRP